MRGGSAAASPDQPRSVRQPRRDPFGVALRYMGLGQPPTPIGQRLAQVGVHTVWNLGSNGGERGVDGFQHFRTRAVHEQPAKRTPSGIDQLGQAFGKRLAGKKCRGLARADADQNLASAFARGGDGGARLAQTVHCLYEDQIHAGYDEQLRLPAMLGKADCCRRHKVGPVAVFKRCNPSSHQTSSAGSGGAGPSALDGPVIEFAPLKRPAGTRKGALRGSKGIRDQNLGPRPGVLFVGRSKDGESFVRIQCVGGPQGKSGGNPAPRKFGADSAVQKNRARARQQSRQRVFQNQRFLRK